MAQDPNSFLGNPPGPQGGQGKLQDPYQFLGDAPAPGGSGDSSRLTNDTVGDTVLNEGARIGSKIVGGIGHSIGGFAHFLLPGATINEEGVGNLRGELLKEGKITPQQAQHSAEFTAKQAKIDRAIAEYTDPGNFFDWIRRKFTTAPATEAGRVAENSAAFIGGMMTPIPGAAKGETPAMEAELNPDKLMGNRMLLARYGRIFGYRFAPSELEGGTVAKEIQGTAGVPHVEQKISDDNAELATKDVRQDLQLPDDAPLNDETYHQLRQQAYGAYADARRLPAFQRDDQLRGEAESFGSKILSYASDHPSDFENADGKHLLAEINRVRNMFLTPEGSTWTGDHAMTAINKLREDARGAYGLGKSYPTILADVYRQAAQALEGRLARAADEQTALDKSFYGLGDAIRASRRLIAKSYTAEGATIAGRINPRALAMARKNGVPLDGSMDRVARLAEMFPKSFRNPATLNKMGAQSGAWFTRMIGMSGMLTHHPGLAIPMLVQGAAKRLAESDLFQPEKLTERAFNKAMDPFKDTNLNPMEASEPSRATVKAGVAVQAYRDGKRRDDDENNVPVQ